ncbi:UTP--glucose-1-phosphate uridylyltransferase [Macleaya cordata]|uniref:UTP--glucose-1-phosphate uridylyltransferase n=1 Tax=Macleaya cordata TaxID=56857 RepID=A0A200PV53_MACCD|nr:UTP--glucose-1-phosphate uridylyltransferase [Macleaya cordata]
MQRTTFLLSSSSSSYSSSSFPLLPITQRGEALLGNRRRHSLAFHSCTKISLDSSHFCRQTLPLRSTVIQEIVETSKDESEFIEIGYICNVHGLQGELRVKPTTDFAELRFSKPGKRWLKERVSGKETIREVEIVVGREHAGQKSWIISFRGIDTVDNAKQLVGSILLVRKGDHPVLEEGEFYTPDLVGMKVVLKDTGEPVGTVINVFDSGANDLLQVMLNSAKETHDGTGSVKQGNDDSGPLVWVPFVEAIVPVVNMNRRVMQITPPRGLLQLNLRSDVRSKKERRQLEWKQRKKATQRLITAKKKLCQMEQKHVFDGLRFGDKAQKSLLADQIVGINFKLFQQAMQNTGMPSMSRWNFLEYMNANATKLLENSLKTSAELDGPCGTKNELNPTEELQEKGLKFISEGKVAIVLVADDKINQSSAEILHLQALLSDEKRFTMEVKDEKVSLPLIVVSPADGIQSIQKLFIDHEYFGFDTEKVWFLDEEKLPVISSSPEEQNRHKILLKTPWEILQSPVGSGGVFNLLSSHNILGNLMETGVEYVQVFSLGKKSVIGDPLFFGFVSSRRADIGIKIDNNSKDFEEDYFNMIFSMRFLKKITTQINKLQFYEVEKQNSEVQLVGKEWVDVVPSSSPNSYELHCSIYSVLNACSSDKICIING